MSMYDNLGQEALNVSREEVLRAYESYCQKGLKLNMARGVPSAEQIDLSEGLLSVLTRSEECIASGIDARNYGGFDGMPEAKQLMASVLGVSPDDVFIGGSSSLNLMYDTVSRATTHGICGEPWCRQGQVKFICPAPGYDRHFGICQHFGIDMIPVGMGADGPDMDAVEALIKDPTVKGMWCVPKYANPLGIVYSDDMVRRIASLRPAAADFHVFWDNAYAVHGFCDEEDTLLNVAEAARAAGNPELIIQFASTSKVTFPGGGISVLAAGPDTLAGIKKSLFYQLICNDKVNQMRHVRFLKDMDGIKAHMKMQAALLKPRFDLVEETLARELTGLASWTTPRGGYFVSLDVMPGTAKKTVALLRQAGVVVTDAGATWPYQNDPEDKNIRIAPTFPPLHELQTAMELLCVCAKLAAVEKRLEILS